MNKTHELINIETFAGRKKFHIKPLISQSNEAWFKAVDGDALFGGFVTTNTDGSLFVNVYTD